MTDEAELFRFAGRLFYPDGPQDTVVEVLKCTNVWQVFGMVVEEMARRGFSPRLSRWDEQGIQGWTVAMDRRPGCGDQSVLDPNPAVAALKAARAALGEDK